MSTEKLYQIKSSYFTAGIVTDIHPKSEDIRVKIAAPIVKYMIGWTLEEVQQYCKRKGWWINNDS
ncbi:MAG: hypothetical protein KDC43_29445 [Saprospiraceae bacterium]|nr:hypothetical protein [Saprospiraceae bacterium]